MTDGKPCQVCAAKDDSADPAFPDQVLQWGYAPRLVNGVYKTQGRTCYYCMKVYQAKYSARCKLGELCSFIGKSQEEHDAFMALRKVCVDKVVEAGDKRAHIVWPTDEQLVQLMEDNIIHEMPDELLVPWSEYVDAYGDPRSNGKGHSTTQNSMGMLCVVVPESNIERRKRQRVSKTQHRRVLDDGRDKLTDDQLVTKFRDVSNQQLAAAGVSSSGAAGCTLDSLLGGGIGGGSIFSAIRARSAQANSAPGGDTSAQAAASQSSPPKVAPKEVDDPAESGAHPSNMSDFFGFGRSSTSGVAAPLAPAAACAGGGESQAARKRTPASSSGGQPAEKQAKQPRGAATAKGSGAASKTAAATGVQARRGRPKHDPSIERRSGNLRTWRRFLGRRSRRRMTSTLGACWCSTGSGCRS